MDEWVNETSNKSMTWYAKQKRKPFCVSLMFFICCGLHCSEACDDDNEVLVFRWLLHMWSLATLLAHQGRTFPLHCQIIELQREVCRSVRVLCTAPNFPAQVKRWAWKMRMKCGVASFLASLLLQFLSPQVKNH